MKPAGTFAQSASASGAVSSDVARDRRLVRVLGGVVVVALLAVLVVLLAGGGRGRLAAGAAPGALSHAHVAAGLTCASCHATEPAAASCAGCHAAAAHRSTRAAHRALALGAGGSLGCVDCHATHDPSVAGEPARVASVTLEGTRATVWQGALGHVVTLSAPAPPARLTLVPRAACARCHAPADPRDPAARCFPGGSEYSSCFDEHGSGPALAVLEAAGRALDGLPSAAALPPPSGAQASSAVSPELGVSAAGLLAGLALTAWPLVRPRRRRAPSAAAFPPFPPPPSPVAGGARRLPVIDASRCLGCRACVDACAFDVLEVERFIAQVVRPDACCGAVTCEVACPNGSLTLVPADAEDSRGAGPQPRLDASLESPEAPMVFLAGDLTGVPLIKHAIRQGRLVAEHVAAKLHGSALPDVYDLVVVGAGPAGLSATLRARELGLSVLTLERGAVGASIAAFPRGKLVFERPLELPLEGELWMEECTKEELIAQWERVVRVHRLPVRAGHLVQSLEPLPRLPGDEGARGARYRVTALPEEGSAPLVVSARALLLAVGTRGTPRPLPAPVDPAVESRVAYSLVDAASFAGRRVLVVGLGDSAMEAALALARQPGCAVTLLARGERFTRGSARTLAELERAVAAKELTLRFGATVAAVTAVNGASTGPAAEAQVRFAGPAGASVVLPFDQMFVFIGGSGPWPLLAQAGVVVRGVS